MTILDITPHVNGEETALLASWLTTGEIEQLNCYSFEKRKNEWLSGRLCAKKATLDLLNHNGSESFGPLDFSIEAGNSGKPFIHFADETNSPDAQVEISITHSRGKAIGMAGNSLCGIDVQHLSGTLFKVRDRFCSDIEMAILEEIPVDEIIHLGLLWVAKEALRKCLSSIRMLGFKELKLTRVINVEDYHLLHFNLAADTISIPDHTTLTVLAHHDKSFAVGICSIDKELFRA